MEINKVNAVGIFIFLLLLLLLSELYKNNIVRKYFENIVIED
jgi:hypothetical protein